MTNPEPTGELAEPPPVAVYDTPVLRSSTALRQRLHHHHGLTLGPDVHALGPALAVYVTAYYHPSEPDTVIFDIVDAHTGATYDIAVPAPHLSGAEDTPHALAQLVVDHGTSALTVLTALCDADGLLTVPLPEALSVVAAAHRLPEPPDAAPSHP